MSMQTDVNQPSSRAGSAGILFQQKGMMLVLVMVYLLAISLLLTSTVSSSTLQMKMMSNQGVYQSCLLYTSPSPRDGLLSRMPSSA